MLNPFELEMAKSLCNFGHSECNRVKALKMKILEFANSKDEAAHNEPSQLDLHCNILMI